MKQEAISLLKKTAKIAGVTCLAAGSVAVLASTAAIHAAAEGFHYLKDRTGEIIKES